ncbi:hypothetical protein CLV24_1337 [Pontibacter ummariensis]|uniref:GMT-like wHTH domain-containing protein n=1 Tax=Pontibacter ummariensis TaxID=1610492 RepID=A0A239KYD8_9BACT|nr:hypothetical protein [Pontibacter ummariensis]PRY04648.1 hypothetical protein CLV24_1337 [Pontibacter ummariensis]SNT23377.1 hypothetical protein SAMN06296052_13335 [Pontibacter ummariensis]
MTATVSNDFFLKERTLPETKSELLGKCFEVWCTSRLTGAPQPAPALFMDLCATLDAGQETESSTPASLLRAIQRGTANLHDLNRRLLAVFGDPDQEAMDGLQQQLERLPYYEKLEHRPLYLREAADKTLVSELLALEAPVFALLDLFDRASPAQYLPELIARENTDLLLLLCPEKISLGLSGKQGKLLTEVLGPGLLRLKGYFKREKDLVRREKYTLSVLREALREKGYLAVQFSVYPPENEGLGHTLLLASKESSAYRGFKEALLPYTTFQEDGIPLFYSNKRKQSQLALFSEQARYTLENLAVELEQQSGAYKYKMIEKVYEEHSLGTDYIRENYVEAFKLLRNRGKVEFLNPKTMQPIKIATATSVVKYRSV